MAVDTPARSCAGDPHGDTSRLASLVSILQLSDSAFPSGRYTLSYGVETLVQSGHLSVPSESSTLLTLLGDTIRFGVAPSDGLALACAHRAVGPDGCVDVELVTRVDERLAAVKLTREAREASTRTGRAVLATAMAAIDRSGLREFARRVTAGRSPGNHAVVIGLLSARLGVQRLDAVVGELYAFSSGCVAAAVRLGLVDHRTAQGLLHRLRPVIAGAAANVAGRDLEQISSCTPLLDVMSMLHEEAELRLFAS
jgi:urease accessory protein